MGPSLAGCCSSPSGAGSCFTRAGLDEFTFREEYAYCTAPHRGSLLSDGVANAAETVVSAGFGRSPSKTAP